jgi:MFS family permease
MGKRVSRSTGLWLVAVAFAVTMIGGALPTPLYPGYEQRFGFGPLTVTVTVNFAMYAVGVLTALLVVGRTSDSMGRRPVLFGGLAASAASSVVFLIAGGMHSGGVALLYVARVLSGVSAGIFAGTATAALADLAGPRRHRRASVVAAAASIGGLGSGPLLSGLLARYVAGPSHTAYVVHLALVLAGAAAVLATPDQ